MYDLHCHSTCSDGQLSPADLVRRARERHVEVLALTDHDTLNGLPDAAATAAEVGIRLIPGIEFSCRWEGRGVHVVGLNFDPEHPQLLQAVAQQEQTRWERAQLIGEKLAKLGIEGAFEGACRLAGEGGMVGRPHFAQYLVEQGRVADIDGAFKRYLGTGKPGDVKQSWPVMEEAIGWIRAAGGLAVLAHPDKYKVTRTRLRAMVEEFRDVGGEGIEVVSGNQNTNVTRDMQQLATRYGLLASCGSDFHFPGQSWQDLGVMPPLPENCTPVWERF